MRLRAVATAVVLVACHGPLAVGAALKSPESDAAWVIDPALAARTTAAAQVMAGVWGGEASVLDGWTITFVDRFERNGKTVVVGKTTRTPVLGGGKVEVWTGTSAVCVEATDLAHEVGHVVIHDHDHADARWRDPAFWDRMAEELCAVVPREDEACRQRLSAGKGIWH